MSCFPTYEEEKEGSTPALPPKKQYFALLSLRRYQINYQSYAPDSNSLYSTKLRKKLEKS